MKNVFKIILVCGMIYSSNLFAQENFLNQLNDNNIIGFSKPLATTLGVGINSGTFHSAKVSKTLGFGITFSGMMIMVPDDQLTFTPTLPEGYGANASSPTFWGEKGGVSYLGPNGYYAMPGGINEQNIPFVMPQITVSFLGTEALIRYIPSFKVGDNNINFIGLGLKHSISQYIPMCPVDIAVQGIYTNLSYGKIIKGKNIALNAQASKDFGLFTAYSALQYESSKFDLDYTFNGDANSAIPELQTDRRIAVEVAGDNNFRFILGGAVKLAFVVINADVNLSSQTVFTSGLSFEF